MKLASSGVKVTMFLISYKEKILFENKTFYKKVKFIKIIFLL